MRTFDNRQVKEDLLRIHAEDAAFVLSQRALAVEAPNYRLIDIYDLEQRLIGHLDALVFAKNAGLAIAHANAASGKKDHVAVLLHVALRLNRRDIINDISFPEEELPEFCRRLAEAVGWCEQTDLALVMSDWMEGTPPFRAIALEICAHHGVDPKHHLSARIADPDPMVRSFAYEAAGRLGRVDCLGLVQEADDDAAVLAAVRLGDMRGAQRLQDAENFPAEPEMARSFAETFPIALPREEATEAIRQLLDRRATRRWGIVAIGALGWVSGFSGLLAVMAEPVHARIAVSAFEQITGLYVAHEELELDEFPEEPDGPDLGLIEHFADTNTPWPDVDKFEAWIAANHESYSAETRLLLGLNDWTFEGAPEPWVKYQSRYRWIATTQALRRPDAPLPNHKGRVIIDGQNFTRKW